MPRRLMHRKYWKCYSFSGHAQWKRGRTARIPYPTAHLGTLGGVFALKLSSRTLQTIIAVVEGSSFGQTNIAAGRNLHSDLASCTICTGTPIEYVAHKLVRGTLSFIPEVCTKLHLAVSRRGFEPDYRHDVAFSSGGGPWFWGHCNQ